MFRPAAITNRRRNRALLVSFVLHVIVIYLLVRPPRPIYVTPSSVAYGHGGTATELVYLSARGAISYSDSAEKPQQQHITLKSQTRPRPKPAPKPSPVTTATDKVTSDLPTQAGSPFGSLAVGPASGHDVRPALPVIFPSPSILPWQIPSGVEGTVIVEVTIDAQGNVTDTRVLQGIGHGIEDKVVAAVRNWRFKPAMMDGRAIPSQQDVHFHFPG